jgi:hypothetical protein
MTRIGRTIEGMPLKLADEEDGLVVLLLDLLTALLDELECRES